MRSMITDLTDIFARFYCNDEYIFKNFSLHNNDSEWKVGSVIKCVFFGFPV